MCESQRAFWSLLLSARHLDRSLPRRLFPSRTAELVRDVREDPQTTAAGKAVHLEERLRCQRLSFGDRARDLLLVRRDADDGDRGWGCPARERCSAIDQPVVADRPVEVLVGKSRPELTAALTDDENVRRPVQPVAKLRQGRVDCSREVALFGPPASLGVRAGPEGSVRIGIGTPAGRVGRGIGAPPVAKHRP